MTAATLARMSLGALVDILVRVAFHAPRPTRAATQARILRTRRLETLDRCDAGDPPSRVLVRLADEPGEDLAYIMCPLHSYSTAAATTVECSSVEKASAGESRAVGETGVKRRVLDVVAVVRCLVPHHATLTFVAARPAMRTMNERLARLLDGAGAWLSWRTHNRRMFTILAKIKCRCLRGQCPSGSRTILAHAALLGAESLSSSV